MKEIVFSDSVKGTMKFAQRYSAEQMLRDGPTVFLGKKSSEDELRRMWAGEPLGGNAQDVLGLSFCLDVGDIFGEVTGLRRAAEIRRLWGAWIPEVDFRHSMKVCADDLEKAKTAAKNGEKIRIWISDAPAAACGLRHILWEIRRCDCPVSVVELPKLWDNGDGTVIHYMDWGEVEPGHFARFLPQERELSIGERRMLSSEWAEAVQENAPLRALVNGSLLSVPEDFYDHLLRKHMPEGPFRMARLIGETLGHHPVGIGDGWYALRIRAMIDSGELKVVDPGDGEHPYSMTLKKA